MTREDGIQVPGNDEVFDAGHNVSGFCGFVDVENSWSVASSSDVDSHTVEILRGDLENSRLRSVFQRHRLGIETYFF